MQASKETSQEKILSSFSLCDMKRYAEKQVEDAIKNDKEVLNKRPYCGRRDGTPWQPAGIRQLCPKNDGQMTLTSLPAIGYKWQKTYKPLCLSYQCLKCNALKLYQSMAATGTMSRIPRACAPKKTAMFCTFLDGGLNSDVFYQIWRFLG